MPKSKIIDVLGDFAGLFFPNLCLGCSNSLVRGENLICTTCLLEMPQTNYHRERDNSLEGRLSLRFPLRCAMAYFKFSKNGRVQQVLHALKYKNHPEIGAALGLAYGLQLADAGFKNAFDIILPVPLHPSRKRKRGYNQSAKFAEGLSAALQIPTTDLVLERKMKTETQTRKSKLTRWENMSDIFSLKIPGEIKDKSVLLVDDVITTGSTLEACALVLLKGGLRDLSIACIAEA